jgi:hypothetical protein
MNRTQSDFARKPAKTFLLAAIVLLCAGLPGSAATVGFADVVLDYFDSGAGPIAGPYGGTFPGGPGFPIPVALTVVLDDDPGPTGFVDFLSLPTGSFVTVGFTDETVVDGPGNDIFISENAGNLERADVFVSSDNVSFTFLGVAVDGGVTSFDLASIGFASPVVAVRIVGLDGLGGSPGFDVNHVQVLPGSIGPAVPEPSTAVLVLSVLAGLTVLQRRHGGHERTR